MFAARWNDIPHEIAVLLAPAFSMMAFVSAIEPLRIANRLADRPLFRWTVLSRDGRPVEASSGMTVMPDRGLSAADRFPSVLVCASFAPERLYDRATLGWLRRQDRFGADLGGIDTGSFLLARAGLLDGYRTTLHWESIPSFAEAFPTIPVGATLFEVHRNRFTCSGGTAPIDMMLHLIGLQFGHNFARRVSDALIHERIRPAGGEQRPSLGERLGLTHPVLVRAIAAMETNLEEPLDSAALARAAGAAPRQLERLFRRHLRETPTRYYLELRLRHARSLLLRTALPVLEVALASGFGSNAHFSRAYRAFFGSAPRDERRAAA